MTLDVTIWDVQHGAATYVRTPNGRTFAIDLGIGSAKARREFSPLLHLKQNYGVEFDMFSKIVVKGPDQAPLYKYLTSHPKFRGEVGWNFEKFLVSRNGEVIGRFKSEVEPLSREMLGAIEIALNGK